MNNIDKLAAANFLDEYADETSSAFLVPVARGAPQFPQTAEGQRQSKRYDEMREIATKLREAAR